MPHAWTRRDFLALTGAALAAGSTGLTSQVSGAETAAAAPLRLKKALKYSMVGGNAPILEKFKMLKEIGFEGIDMDRPADHDEVLKARDETGLVIHGVVDYVHWKLPLSHPDPQVRAEGVEGLRTALRDCKIYGGDTVLLVVGIVNKDISYADAWTRTQAEIRKALPLAEELGIRILFENVWNNFLLSPLEMARYIDEFESPWVGAYFDVGNIITYGWPEHWIRILGKRIGKLDIKEFSREKQESDGLRAGFRVELGEGDCDWPAVIAALDDIGYEGWGTAEVRGGDRERLLEISQRMDRILART